MVQVVNEVQVVRVARVVRVVQVVQVTDWFLFFELIFTCLYMGFTQFYGSDYRYKHTPNIAWANAIASFLMDPKQSNKILQQVDLIR